MRSPRFGVACVDAEHPGLNSVAAARRDSFDPSIARELTAIKDAKQLAS